MHHSKILTGFDKSHAYSFRWGQVRKRFISVNLVRLDGFWGVPKYLEVTLRSPWLSYPSSWRPFTIPFDYCMNILAKFLLLFSERSAQQESRFWRNKYTKLTISIMVLSVIMPITLYIQQQQKFSLLNWKAN